MARTRAILIAVLIVIIVAAGVAYYYLTLPKKVELTLFTKAGLWADFIRESGVLERFKERMLKDMRVDVEIKILTAPHRGYGERLVAALAAGEGGDVMWVSPVLLPGMVDAGYLLDLTPYVEKWDKWNEFFESVKALVTYKGKVYAIPNDAATILIYYRTDLFKKAGLPVPWQPKSWKEVLEAARIIKEKLPEVEVPLSPYYGGEIQLPVYSTGEDIYDPKDGKFFTKSDGLRFLFKLYYDCFYTYEVTPRELILEKWDTRKLFQEGKLAIMVDGTWCYYEKWGIGMAYEIKEREVIGYTYPPGSGEPGVPLYVTAVRDYTWAINAKTENPDLAWELVKELVEPDIMAKWGVDTAHLVARRDAIIGDYAKDEFMTWAAEALELEGAKAKPCLAETKKYLDTLKSVVKDYIVDAGESPEECLKIFASKVTEGLGADKVKEG